MSLATRLGDLIGAIGTDIKALYSGLAGKQETLIGAATSIASSNLTASRALASDASGKVAVSAVTAAELDFLSGVTSAIQTQINGKSSIAGSIAQAFACANLAFPATQLLSSDPNTLDDYEEGEFSPIAVGSTSAGTGTYSFNKGVYTKVGRLVFFTSRLSWTAHTGTGDLSIANMPFTSSAAANTHHSASILSNGLTLASRSFPVTSIAPGATAIGLFLVASSTGALTALPMDTSVAGLTITGFYEV